MTAPLITVLMPVFNSELYIARAVKSILEQSFDDFEFLIINDGSTDRSMDIVREFKDPRVRIIDTENRGVAAALQLGIKNARGGYIARMDADDESLPDRLKIEKLSLDKNPHIAVVHSSVEYIDTRGQGIHLNRDEGYDNAITKWLLNWKNVPIHSTVMMRAAVLKDHALNYSLKMNRAEDFDLWNRIAQVSDFLYLPDVLVRYRIHSENVSNSSPIDLQMEAQCRVISENFKRYNIEINDDMALELVVISGASRKNPISSCYRQLNGSLHILAEKLSSVFCSRFSIEKRALASVMSLQYLRWARYMLNTSRRYTIQLLLISFRTQKKIIMNYAFWKVVAALLLPAKCE